MIKYIEDILKELRNKNKEASTSKCRAMIVSLEHVKDSLEMLPTTKRPVDCLVVDSQVTVQPADYAVVICPALAEQILWSLRKHILNWKDKVDEVTTPLEMARQDVEYTLRSLWSPDLKARFSSEINCFTNRSDNSVMYKN